VNVVLRPATDADRPFLEALYAESRAAELAFTNFDDAEKAAFCAQQFAVQDRSIQQYRNLAYDVIVVDGIDAGRLVVSRGDALHLVDILLGAEHRGAGTGTALLCDLVDEADRDGRDITLTVEATNPARRLYERLGFVAVDADDGAPFVAYRRAAQANTAS
jgi:ribosomal protein S18 acetylase RimI-like enzyme